jgi:AraC-like DNA-binding protein
MYRTLGHTLWTSEQQICIELVVRPFSSVGDALDVISRDVGFTDAKRMRSAFIRAFGFFSREMPQCAADKPEGGRLTSIKASECPETDD